MFVKRVVTAVLVGVLLTPFAAADPHRTGAQRPSQPQPQVRDGQRGDQRGGPPGGAQRSKWWQDEKIKADLRLAPEQTARIEEIFETAFPKMKDIYDDLRRREEQLSNLISGNDVTEVQVLKQVDQVEAVRSSMSKARTLMLFRMRRVLSADQRTKLAEIEKAHDKERGPGRLPERTPTDR